jgi:hypothetical protein
MFEELQKIPLIILMEGVKVKLLVDVLLYHHMEFQLKVIKHATKE